jgi:C1A family cysteine protease
MGLQITEKEKRENERKARKALMDEVNEGNIKGPASKSKDWRQGGIVTPVKDQGCCGSCGAFATAAVMEAGYKIKTGEEKDLSEWYILANASGDCYFGSTFPFLLASAQAGAPLEQCCPYMSGWTYVNGVRTLNDLCGLNGTLHTDCPQYIDQSCPGSYAGQRIKALSAATLRTINKAKAALLKGPIMTGMEVFTDFYDVNSEAVYKQTSGEFEGNHAICIVGFDSQGWIVKNSWGTYWGAGGFCRIAYNQCGIGTKFPFYTFEM